MGGKPIFPGDISTLHWTYVLEVEEGFSVSQLSG